MDAVITTEVVGSQQPGCPRASTTKVVDYATMTWHDIIRDGRDALGLSQAKLAKAIGASQATVAKIEQGLVQSSALLPAIIKELGLDVGRFPEEAFGRAGTGPDSPRVLSRAPQALPEFARDPAYWAMAAGLVGDVPLYASAEGGQGALLIERDSIGTVKRPPLLQGVKDGYAIFLVGESMSPEFEPGDILMVNPRLPVIANTSCVFYDRSDNEPRAMVKRFLAATEDEWRVRQFSPDREFALDRSEWETRHRIVSKNFR